MIERAYKFIDDDAVMMNNGDRMVDASTAYMAVDIAEMEMKEEMINKAASVAIEVFWDYKDPKCSAKMKRKVKTLIEKMREQ